jgi:CheY-like chemotaxis protein
MPKKIHRRRDADPRDGVRKYGKATFADPVNKKYPIDTPGRTKAAWAYLHQLSNAEKYTEAEVRTLKLDLWRQRGADLVMLDLQLPDMNAIIDTVAQFRGAAPELPIIAMASGDRSGLDVLADAYLLGVKAVLPKPFHLHQVLDLVARVLGKDEASEAS